MSFIITILAALLVFSAVIAIHEFGHFIVAKLCGIQVNEFSIGMGPVLWKKNHKGTQYSLRALPVGGFVALEGEESPESQQAEAVHTVQEQPAPETEAPVQLTGIPLNEAPVWQRALVMVAGAVMNFVLGFVVLVFLIAAQNEPITSKTIYAIQDGALCGQTGLQAGDKVLAVNGRRCFVANDILYELVRTRSYSADFTVLRDGQKVQLPGVQFDTWQDEKGETHMSIGFSVYGLEKTPGNVLREAGNSVLYYGRIVFTSLVDLVRGRRASTTSPARWVSCRPSGRPPAMAGRICWSCWRSSPSTLVSSTYCLSRRWMAARWYFWSLKASPAMQCRKSCKACSPLQPSGCCSG